MGTPYIETKASCLKQNIPDWIYTINTLGILLYDDVYKIRENEIIESLLNISKAIYKNRFLILRNMVYNCLANRINMQSVCVCVGDPMSIVRDFSTLNFVWLIRRSVIKAYVLS